MKIIALGDTHGRETWKKITEKHADADTFVFIGDYFDTHESITPDTQIKNFREILEFKKANREKVVLLLGNHDFHYLPLVEQKYSGFQFEAMGKIMRKITPAVEEGMVQVAWSKDKWLFTHAGVTKVWAEACGLSKKEDIAGAINGLFIRTPQLFNFTFGVSGDVYGGDPANGPLWVRPEALTTHKIDGYKQVVGHTIQKSITEKDGVFFIDALGSGEYLEITDKGANILKI